MKKKGEYKKLDGMKWEGRYLENEEDVLLSYEKNGILEFFIRGKICFFFGSHFFKKNEGMSNPNLNYFFMVINFFYLLFIFS